MKRILTLFLTLVLSLTMLTACQSGPSSSNGTTSVQNDQQAVITQEMQDAPVEQAIGDKDAFKGLTIGFSQRNIAGSEWYENLIRVAKMEAEHLGIKLIVLDAQNDISKQLSDIENLISQNVDAIILNPQDSSGVLPAVKKIHAANIPLVVVNSALDEAGAPFSFVSTNAFNTGYKSGLELAKAVDKKYGWKDVVKAAVLSANPQELESDQRRYGQLSGYQDYMLQTYGKSNLQIVAFDYYNWLPDKALNVMTDMLQANPDIDVVFSACDGGAQGVIPALQAAGKLGDVLVTSIDGRKTVIGWLKDGDKGVVSSVLNDPRLMGKWGVYFAANEAKNISTPSTFYVPNPAVNADNYDKYYFPDSNY